MISTYLPPVDVQRQLITSMRNEFQAAGFEHALNADALRAQTPDGTDDARKSHEKDIQDHELSAANAYAAARRMDERLAQLPKEEKS